MSKLMKTHLLAFLLVGVIVGSLAATNNTKFTNLEVTSNLTVDGTLTSASCITSPTNLTENNITATYGVVTSTLTATGTSSLADVTASTATLSGAQGLRMAQGHITAASTVPAAAGILATDSSWNLYISTGTGAGAWVKVGGQ